MVTNLHNYRRLPLQALTPLTIGRNRAAASALGALWGFGHSTGQLILGLVFVILKVCAGGQGGHGRHAAGHGEGSTLQHDVVRLSAAAA